MTRKAHIAIIGAGLMGHGIALTFAMAGQRVSIFDPSCEMLHSVHDRIADSARLLGVGAVRVAELLDNVTSCPSLREAVSNVDYVFEAAPEKLPLKQAIFADIETHAPSEAVLASNTSVIQISKIMQGLKVRRRALGTHWWNPPHMIPLVEVVKTEWTDPAAAHAVFDLLEHAGKTPVMVEKDVPGFIGNRLQHALWREAISLVENGICTAKAVDDVVKSSFGRRLAVLGPLENADLVGIELTQDIHRQVLFDLENSPEPSPYLQELRERGRNGMASGAGFRDWARGDLEATKSKISEHLLDLDALLRADETHRDAGPET
ncbi:MAG: 3-hydroxyacyl-CoA dehydrogenase family protein [Pseudomonadota bacterium]